MADFVEVTTFDALPAGRGASFTVSGKAIALFNVDGTVYAIDDGCLHHGSSLASGRLDGKIVTCPAHGWRYNVTTGFLSHVPDYGVACYPVQVTDGKVLVAV